MWWRLFWWIITTALTDLLTKRPPDATPAGVGDFGIPTATEGRVVPIVLGGTVRLRAPNCIWYGDYAAIERTESTGVIIKKDVTIGFTYELALAYALFKGRCAGITRIWIGDDVVWDKDVDNGGALGVVCDVDRPDLFGGEDSGGGFSGRFRLFDGAEDQPVSAFLAARITEGVPAYRGTSYVMVTDVTETRGATLGESPNLRYINIEVQTFDTVANGGLGDELGLGNDHHFIGADANPISVAWRSFVDDRWGRGLAVSQVDQANFKAAAETCWTEGIGFTMLIDEFTTTNQIQDWVEQHVDGYIGPNAVTGKFEVNLARPDYVLANEFQADDSNIQGVPVWNKGDWTQTFNRVRMRYADRDKDWNETHAVANAPANRIIQGRLVSQEVRYPGVHDAVVANKIVAREKKNLARAVKSGTVEINREAWELRPGKVFSFTSTEADESNLPVRITKVEVGDPIKNTMVFEVVEDVFDNETPTVADPPDTDFVPPVQAVVPFAAADQAAASVPRTLMRYDTLPDLVPRIVTFARRTGGAPTRYEVVRRTRAVFGTGSYGAFASSGFVTAGFCQCGELRNAEGAWQAGNGSLTMQVDPVAGESLDNLIGNYAPSATNGAGVAVIAPGSADEEWLAFTSIVDDLGGVRLEGLHRGAMDSPMESHAVGARIWFVWTGGVGLPEETYTPGQGVEVKLLPSSPNDAVVEAAATAIPEVEMLDPSRDARPLLPRTLQINDVEFPSTASADFVAQTGPVVVGLRFDVEPRLWNVDDILDQVLGLDPSGLPITDSSWASQTVDLEYWLYDLDSTPSPVRGVDELVTGALVWDTASKSFVVSRSDLESGGVTIDFAARIEIEVEHSPAGETPDQIVKRPMFFDFDVTGTWGVVFFAYSEVSFHSHFDGADAATSATDESDQAHAITFLGTAQLDTAQSVFGGAALNFPATGDSVDLPSNAVFQFGTGDFTIEMRVRTTVVQVAAQIIYEGRQGGAIAPVIYVNNNGTLNFFTNGANRISSAGGAIAANTWYKVAVSRVAGTTRMFVDGVQVGGDYADTNDYVIHAPTLGNDTADTGSFRGWLDEVRIIKGTGLYGAAYTPPTDEYWFHRVAFLAGFNGVDGATSYTTEDRYLQTATFFGNAQIDTAQSRFGGSSLLLDGTGDYLSFPGASQHDLAANDFTIECFVRFNGDPAPASQNCMIALWDDQGGFKRGWSLQLSSNRLLFSYSTNGANNTEEPENWDPVSDTWYHVAVCRSGTTLRHFVDGVQIGTNSTMSATVFAPVAPLTVGSLLLGGGPGNFLNGWIEEARVTNGKALYTAGFTPPTAPLDRV